MDNAVRFAADTLDMRRNPLSSRRGRALAGFGLALFLLGINWCLVGAVLPSEQRMACMPAAAATPHADAARPAAHGGHCAGMTQESEDEAPVTAPAPCCIALTPVLAPEAGHLQPHLIALLDLPFEAPTLAAPPQGAGELLRAPPESPPHLAALRAPASSRAPPTA